MKTNTTNMMNLTLNVVNITLCNIRPSEGSPLFSKFGSWYVWIYKLNIKNPQMKIWGFFVLMKFGIVATMVRAIAC